MIKRLDHIAIAVPDLDAALQRFVNDLGLKLAGQEDVPTQSTSTAFLPITPTSAGRLNNFSRGYANP